MFYSVCEEVVPDWFSCSSLQKLYTKFLPLFNAFLFCSLSAHLSFGGFEDQIHAIEDIMVNGSISDMLAAHEKTKLAYAVIIGTGPQKFDLMNRHDCCG